MLHRGPDAEHLASRYILPCYTIQGGVAGATDSSRQAVCPSLSPSITSPPFPPQMRARAPKHARLRAPLRGGRASPPRRLYGGPLKPWNGLGGTPCSGLGYKPWNGLRLRWALLADVRAPAGPRIGRPGESIITLPTRANHVMVWVTGHVMVWVTRIARRQARRVHHHAALRLPQVRAPLRVSGRRAAAGPCGQAPR